MNQPRKPPSFGEIDLEGDDDGSLDLATGAARELPKQEYSLDELTDLPTAPKTRTASPTGQPPTDRKGKIQDKGGAPAQPRASAATTPAPQAQPQARPRPAPPQAPAKVPEQADGPRPPRPRRPAPEQPPEPRRSYAREIKIALLVIAGLGLIGGGVFGFLKWREGVRQAEEEQLRALDQGSLDSLRNDALTKGKLGT
jgi:hypothetical protein